MARRIVRAYEPAFETSPEARGTRELGSLEWISRDREKGDSAQLFIWIRVMTSGEFNHLLTTIEALSPGEMRRLRQQIDTELSQHDPPTNERKKPRVRTSGKGDKRPKAGPTGKKMSEAEFDQHLLEIGLISSLPDPALDLDDDDPDDQPVTTKGEPLSETIIRERR
jgi:hypothetical protein